MDYRIRKYYLIMIPGSYFNTSIGLLKLVSSLKIHTLPSKNIPEWASKVMVSCRYRDDKTLLFIIRELSYMLRQIYKDDYILRYKEITKDTLGQ